MEEPNLQWRALDRAWLWGVVWRGLVGGKPEEILPQLGPVESFHSQPSWQPCVFKTWETVFSCQLSIEVLSLVNRGVDGSVVTVMRR